MTTPLNRNVANTLVMREGKGDAVSCSLVPFFFATILCVLGVHWLILPTLLYSFSIKYILEFGIRTSKWTRAVPHGGTYRMSFKFGVVYDRSSSHARVVTLIQKLTELLRIFCWKLLKVCTAAQKFEEENTLPYFIGRFGSLSYDLGQINLFSKWSIKLR